MHDGESLCIHKQVYSSGVGIGRGGGVRCPPSPPPPHLSGLIHKPLCHLSNLINFHCACNFKLVFCACSNMARLHVEYIKLDIQLRHVIFYISSQ